MTHSCAHYAATLHDTNVRRAAAEPTLEYTKENEAQKN